MKPIDYKINIQDVQIYAVRLWAYGGITGINDYLMSDNSIMAFRPHELPVIPNHLKKK